MSTNDILIPIAPGELVDRITILTIKSEQISDAEKLKNVRYELALSRYLAEAHIAASDALDALWKELESINRELWVIEDDIRECEAREDFGEAFIALARAVYKTNDRRAAVKKQINLLLGSAIVEEKSYYEA